tara:strand:+ start:1351 stop:2649 length:1299 start_codon:yes stop_codon:yes gene_type:complete
MSFAMGNREAYLQMLRQEREDAKAKRLMVQEESESESEEEMEEEPYQTFPAHTNEDTVIKQGHDLTCGMRCLQNIYGVHIVTKEEMDNQAKFLEQKESTFSDNVEPKYDPRLGDYSIEVLQSVLENKGKWAQRIDIHKIPADYFVPVLEKNPTFVGYIVALPGHYVVIKYNHQSYKCLDSIKGIATRLIDKRTLLKKRDGRIFCSQDSDDQRPVVALLAIGGSPFVEYSLLHSSWSPAPPTPDKFIREIDNVLRPSRNLRNVRDKEVLGWYKKWKTMRVPPSEKTTQHLTTVVRERLKTERAVIIKRNDEQAVIRCSSAEGLIKELLNMQWISKGSDFYFQMDSSGVVDEYDNELDLQAEGALQDFGIAEGSVITLNNGESQGLSANIGGFYTFECRIEGTCIGQQHNAYSVRDKEGKVHVVYKKCIQTIKR